MTAITMELPPLRSPFMEAVLVGTSTSGKTSKIEIVNKRSGDLLTTIEWYPAWRQYCEEREEGTVFSGSCDRAIANFLDELNRRHKAALSAAAPERSL